MKKETFIDAMQFVDEGLIEKFTNMDSELRADEKIFFGRERIIKICSLTACVLILAVGALGVVPDLFDKWFDNEGTQEVLSESLPLANKGLHEFVYSGVSLTNDFVNDTVKCEINEDERYVLISVLSGASGKTVWERKFTFDEEREWGVSIALPKNPPYKDVYNVMDYIVIWSIDFSRETPHADVSVNRFYLSEEGTPFYTDDMTHSYDLRSSEVFNPAADFIPYTVILNRIIKSNPNYDVLTLAEWSKDGLKYGENNTLLVLDGFPYTDDADAFMEKAQRLAKK